MLSNVVPLWEMMLAAIKLGAVIIPATTLLARDDLLDRFERGGVRHVVVGAADAGKFADIPGDYTRIAVGGRRRRLDRASKTPIAADAGFSPDAPTQADRSDAALLHLRHDRRSRSWCVHTHQSYPVGHLSTMYWIGLQRRRRPPQHQLARLGQARLELLLRAVERRRHRVHLQLRALQRQGRARRRGPLRRDHAVRAADRLAAAHPGGSRRASR